MNTDFTPFGSFDYEAMSLSGILAVCPPVKNPQVGAVIIHDNKIIGEGFHESFGGPHAEVNALNNVSHQFRYLLPDSEIFVSAEPCNHYGKTPPCTDAIIQNGIRKVTIASIDQNPKMSGKSIELLKARGIQVRTGLLEHECKNVIAKFLSVHQKKMPYVLLKWAQTKDRYIGKKGKQVWLSNKASQLAVHRWRSEYEAIMVGTETVLIDNPKLTNRRGHGQNPIRIILDRRERIPKDAHIFNQDAKTIVCTSNKNYQLTNNHEIIVLQDEHWELPSILQELQKRNISSLMVEGGKELINSFIRHNLWNEARVIQCPHHLESGIKAPFLKGKLISQRPIISDNLLYISNLQ